ncbi:hypothetical protein B0H17DRAFT_1283219 [Mycena rosella]|uniref:Uncharacterized protein n=1 Tax=Mycena rosella TaxID=1033263 RepID=A0AAD7GFJ6_MYCRO|nr:hypothetical protein B0H17DRAFT_1283219 [Mycena rosella]
MALLRCRLRCGCAFCFSSLRFLPPPARPALRHIARVQYNYHVADFGPWHTAHSSGSTFTCAASSWWCSTPPPSGAPASPSGISKRTPFSKSGNVLAFSAGTRCPPTRYPSSHLVYFSSRSIARASPCQHPRAASHLEHAAAITLSYASRRVYGVRLQRQGDAPGTRTSPANALVRPPHSMPDFSGTGGRVRASPRSSTAWDFGANATLRATEPCVRPRVHRRPARSRPERPQGACDFSVNATLRALALRLLTPRSTYALARAGSPTACARVRRNAPQRSCPASSSPSRDARVQLQRGRAAPGVRALRPPSPRASPRSRFGVLTLSQIYGATSAGWASATAVMPAFAVVLTRLFTPCAPASGSGSDGAGRRARAHGRTTLAGRDARDGGVRVRAGRDAPSSRALFEDMGYDGGGVNSALRRKDLAMEYLLLVDEEKEEEKRAIEARKMASGASNAAVTQAGMGKDQTAEEDEEDENDENEKESEGTEGEEEDEEEEG